MVARIRAFSGVFWRGSQDIQDELGESSKGIDKLRAFA